MKAWSWSDLGRSWGGLGRSWGDLGWSWGGIWKVLGRSWGVLGGLGAILRRSWWSLGASFEESMSNPCLGVAFASSTVATKLSHANASSPPAKRAATEPVSKNPRAYAFNMFTTNAFNNCFQIACTMLMTLVPLDWFACLLFVFFSERFPFICRAGLCWTPFLCTGTVFGAPRAEN